MTTYLTDEQMDRLAPRAIANMHRINMGPRLAEAASRHLGCRVTFLRWEPTGVAGQERPVFSVPTEHIARARSMALTVDAA